MSQANNTNKKAERLKCLVCKSTLRPRFRTPTWEEEIKSGKVGLFNTGRFCSDSCAVFYAQAAAKVLQENRMEIAQHLIELDLIEVKYVANKRAKK